MPFIITCHAQKLQPCLEDSTCRSYNLKALKKNRNKAEFVAFKTDIFSHFCRIAKYNTRADEHSTS
jgi:hypothetical protein